MRALGVEHELLDEGLAELAELVRGCAALVTDRVRVVADLTIARGLDYYTGTVFETRLDGYESLGSICSGGRYDALASDGRTTYPGVGISLGVSRVLVPLLARTGLTACRSVPSAVLVAVVDEDSRAASSAIAAALRARGVACEVAPGRGRSSASRSATPSAAASRTSGSPRPTAATRSRTSAPASRSRPTRPPGPRRRRTSGPASARRTPTQTRTPRRTRDPHP